MASHGLTRLRELCRPPTDPAIATRHDAAARRPSLVGRGNRRSAHRVKLTSAATGVAARALPAAGSGVIIAMIVLLAETGAAIRSARSRRMQSSLNLALGSGLAGIGLTIPAVAALSPIFSFPLTLGLPPLQIVWLTLTLLVSAITLGSGSATVMHGAIHLVLFAAFLFLTVVPQARSGSSMLGPASLSQNLRSRSSVACRRALPQRI